MLEKEIRLLDTNGEENKEDNSNIGLWLLHNPFQINLINTNLQIGKYDNPLRALAINWKQYLLNGYVINESRTYLLMLSMY